MTSEDSTLPPAGWHPDPTASGQLRYWSGTTWTEEVRPAATETPSSVPENAPYSPYAPQYPSQTTPLAFAPDQRTSFTPPSALPSQLPPRSGGETGFFRSLFDLSFASDRVVTVSFARVIYLIAAILSALGWLTGAVVLFLMGNVTYGGEVFTIWGILQLIFGWIGVLLNMVVIRVLLEAMIAQIRTSQHTAKLVQLASIPGAAS